LYRELLRDARFFAMLLEIDREALTRARVEGCPRCGGRLHAAHFQRKPRGLPPSSGTAPAQYSTRFDLCCASCRSRTLPPSVRFLSRKVYLAVVVALATVLTRGADVGAVRLLRRELGMAGSTLLRWRMFWRELGGSSFVQRLDGVLPVGLDRALLPDSLLARLEGELTARVLSLLRLLGPLTGTASPAPSALFERR
jgi:ribosomal protein S27AE